MLSCRELQCLQVQILGFATGMGKEWGEDQVACISKCKYLSVCVCVGGHEICKASTVALLVTVFFNSESCQGCVQSK